MSDGQGAARGRPMVQPWVSLQLPCLQSSCCTRCGESCCTGRGHSVVILDGASADADRTDDFSFGGLKRKASGESDESTVGYLDVEQRASRLGELADRSGCHVEVPGSAGLLDGNVNAAEPCS